LGLELANKTQEGLVLAEEKRKHFNEIKVLKKEREKEMKRKENKLSKMVDSLTDDASQSYIVGFENALE